LLGADYRPTDNWSVAYQFTSSCSTDDLLGYLDKIRLKCGEVIYSGHTEDSVIFVNENENGEK